MTDCLPCMNPFAFAATKAQNSGFITSTSEKFTSRVEASCHRNDRLNLIKAKAGKNNRFVLGSEGYKFPDELGFKEKGEQQQLELDSRIGREPTMGNGQRMESSGILDILDMKGRQKIRESGEGGEEQDLVRAGDEKPAPENGVAAAGGRRGRLLVRRSNLLAKQVISVQSARSLGFVSQIWVDIVSWVVLVIEVRPNLLAGEPERFLQEDVSQVGDVILVEDETVLEKDLKKGCLETLVCIIVCWTSQVSCGCLLSLFHS
uniref:Uncharacterized protein MANES_09G123200 n=1 Tax=Rhizophora mucronata TaxID=61149 RepID=A0A2P2J8U1_RHIMU